MGSIQQFEQTDIRPENPLFSSTKTLIETIFYGNNVELIPDLESAYYKAEKAPGTIVTDLPVKHADKLALPADAKVLVGNDGKIVGRTSAARVIIG